MKIIDAFTFYNAYDVLKMRLTLHYPFVDAFYICESNRAYSGRPKPYNFLEHKDEFAPWMDKIHYIQFNPDCSGMDFSHRDKEINFDFNSPAWILEFRQRNEFQKVLADLADDDVVLISDMDEFVSHNTFSAIRKFSAQQEWEDARLHMTLHHYYMNCIKPKAVWRHPYVCKGKKFRELHSVSWHRHRGVIPAHFVDAGWHFSYLGGFDVVMDKFLATSHTEFLTAGLNDEQYVKDCMKFGIAPSVERPVAKLQNCEFAFLPLDAFPPEIQELMLACPQFVKFNLGA